MRAVAAWLVARPLNGILVLAATSSPYLGFLSAALIVMLVLHDGTRVAALKAAAAGLLLAVIGMVVGTPPSVVVAVAVVYWLPAMLLATLLAALHTYLVRMSTAVLPEMLFGCFVAAWGVLLLLPIIALALAALPAAAQVAEEFPAGDEREIGFDVETLERVRR